MNKLFFLATLITLPLFTVLALASALSIGFWLSALNVKYRDVRYTIPFMVQLWLFASPVAYSSSLVPEKWQAVYAINPTVGVVEEFPSGALGQGRTSRADADSILFAYVCSTIWRVVLLPPHGKIFC